MDFASLNESAQKIIRKIFYMVIATVNEDDTPWISPVYFNFDDQCRLYWVSSRDARHSNNLRQSSRASISIFDSTCPVWEGNGVYLQCEVKELSEPDDIENAIGIYYGGRHIPHQLDRLNIDDYQGDKPWRFYEATPFDITVLGSGAEINGYAVDKRIPATGNKGL